MAQGERLEQGAPQGKPETLVKLDPKDLLEKLGNQGTWVRLGRGDLRALQGKQVKMEKQEKEETAEKMDSLDQQDPEDSQVLQGLPV